MQVIVKTIDGKHDYFDAVSIKIDEEHSVLILTSENNINQVYPLRNVINYRFEIPKEEA